jgi:microcystin-dependent protein
MVQASTLDTALQADPSSCFLGPLASTYGPYSATAGTTLAPSTIGNNGANTPHPNMMPYTVLNICIALVGLFPPRN